MKVQDTGTRNAFDEINLDVWPERGIKPSQGLVRISHDLPRNWLFSLVWKLLNTIAEWVEKKVSSLESQTVVFDMHSKISFFLYSFSFYKNFPISPSFLIKSIRGNPEKHTRENMFFGAR